MTRRAPMIPLLIATFLVTAAHAQPAPNGFLTAFACEPMPKPLRVNSQVLDNTAENLRIHELLLKTLAASGVTVHRDADQTLNLDIRLVREATRRRPSDLIDARVGETEEVQGREGFAKFHVNIWSTAKDSVIGGGLGSADAQLVDRLRISATINSRRDGRCLWRGEVVHNLDGRAANRAADQMIPLLVDAIGTSTNQKPIDID